VCQVPSENEARRDERGTHPKWKPMHFAKRRMTGREVHALASQLRGGACLGAKGQTEKYGKYAGMWGYFDCQTSGSFPWPAEESIGGRYIGEKNDASLI
jgi:hypothetical protein